MVNLFTKNTNFNQSQFAMKCAVNIFVLSIEVRERAMQSFCNLKIRGKPFNRGYYFRKYGKF